MTLLHRSSLALAGVLGSAALLAPLQAIAHDGHGLTGGHWHATDTAGFVLVAAAVVAGVWWARRK